MQTEYLAISVAAALIGLLSGYVFRGTREKAESDDLRVNLARKTEESLALGRQLAEATERHKTEIADLRSRAETALELLSQEKEDAVEEAKNAACPFRIQITPFVQHIKDSGIFTDTHKYTRGLQYQLVVHGVPCFEPHYIVEEIFEESSFDHAKLEQLANLASDLLNPGGIRVSLLGDRSGVGL